MRPSAVKTSPRIEVIHAHPTRRELHSPRAMPRASSRGVLRSMWRTIGVAAPMAYFPFGAQGSFFAT